MPRPHKTAGDVSAAAQVLSIYFTGNGREKKEFSDYADLPRARPALKQLKKRAAVRKSKEAPRTVPGQKPAAVLKTRQALR